jgi:YD repeat-containing protein
VKTQNNINNGRQGTQTTFYADGLINCISYPDQGKSCTTYPNATEVDKTVWINSQSSDKTESMLDGYGRVVNLIDTGAGTEVDTSYDALGHVYSATNPYFTGGGSSAAKAYYAYDLLSRVTGILYADGTSTLTNSYSGNTTTTTDPVGNETQRKTDALGRLKYVWEPTSPNTTPTIETDYLYNALNDLTNITQWGGPSGSGGARSRSFSYDGLSQLIKATNPETGTICYGTWNGSTCQSSYDGNGNLWTKTDARGVQTNYLYDHLNRMVSKSYSNASSGTPVDCFEYDTSSVSGSCSVSSGNLIGNVTNEWTQRSGTSCTGSGTNFAPVTGSFLSVNSFLCYDPMSRPTSLREQQCIGVSCTTPTTYSLNMGYDLQGDLASLTNSIGAQNQPVTLTNSYDGAGRPCLTTSNWSGNAISPFPQNLFSVSGSSTSPGYAASGGLQNWYLGSASSSASSACGSATSPLSITQGYTNRLQLNNITVTGQVP